ncbi:hypothetical protein N1E27_15925 [Pseudomonas aeruginosa]|nr:hypothetical protein [Pseudomonas aeruginosa]MCS9497603.1 hypothetical protein [Pseudomonas aeruginosa]MCS9603463.1 hypothetical protein [Pseudomonas aeruginosa]MCT1296433.1 hypothetical protein [Pseudomonas aeruginosa]
MKATQMAFLVLLALCATSGPALSDSGTQTASIGHRGSCGESNGSQSLDEDEPDQDQMYDEDDPLYDEADDYDSYGEEEAEEKEPAD